VVEIHLTWNENIFARDHNSHRPYRLHAGHVIPAKIEGPGLARHKMQQTGANQIARDLDVRLSGHRHLHLG